MSTNSHHGVGADRAPQRRPSRRVRHWGTTLGLAIVALGAAIAVLAPLLAPSDPYAQDLSNRLLAPAWTDSGSVHHLLGTDLLGRDYLSRLIYGARISLTIGISTVLTAGLIGVPLGALGGVLRRARGRTRDVHHHYPTRHSTRTRGAHSGVSHG